MLKLIEIKNKKEKDKMLSTPYLGYTTELEWEAEL